MEIQWLYFILNDATTWEVFLYRITKANLTIVLMPVDMEILYDLYYSFILQDN